MFNPVSTYRIQFHKNFSLTEFEKIIPYLKKLGIKTVYASPITEAVPGSTHGYDGIHPQRINPEIGTKKQLHKISKQLQQAGIHWLQDIVPNHMAFHSDNTWLMDVLEKGTNSNYASFFDILWKKDEPLMVPFLGDTLESIVKKKELKLQFSNSRIVFAYYENTYPINFHSYTSILQCKSDQPEEIGQLIDRIEKLKAISNKEKLHTESEQVLEYIGALKQNKEIKLFFDQCLEEINKDPEALISIANQQYYRLCSWQETDQQINFRRFFTINGLICLNIQHPEVFHAYHALIKDLLKEGIIHGLRVDHIDGLYDPASYLKQLRELAGEETYIIVEKILELGEKLPQPWMIQGTTGYDFLSLVNNVFTYSDNKNKFDDFYNDLTADNRTLHERIREKKSYILFKYMNGELENLVQLFKDQNLVDKEIWENLKPDILRNTIAEFLIQCPVYRYYGNKFPLNKKEHTSIQHIVTRIYKTRAELSPALILLENAFLKNPLKSDDDYNDRVAHFYKRCMQFTGPLMAKGVEDTLMYVYNRFIGHNEVGDSPESFGISIGKFHEQMQERQKYWPLSMNASATHDTKRGEDANARLTVLTDMGEEWLVAVSGWAELNQKLKKDTIPDDNDEYFIYQTLVATYPMPGQTGDNYLSRLQEYLTKALREAKRNSNWDSPNEEYEKAAKDFATAILHRDHPFLSRFEKFHKKVSDAGIVNSLSKVLLKFTCPGIPDIYQGCEHWDLSFVDPDNRRPVNFESRSEELDHLQMNGIEPPDIELNRLWQNRYDANIKLWLTHSLLQERNLNIELFSKGHYYPLKVKGKYKENILAFARRHEGKWIATVIPLHTAQICKEQKKDIDALDWKNTRIIFPEESPDEWEHVFLKTKGKTKDDLLVQDLLDEIPIGMIRLQQKENDRGAGILMHITSLPSPFGIGDFGPEARSFADFLSKSGQKYWQLLPLNPTESGTGHSPYSSISSMAGNTLLISPELLAEEGLLQKAELKAFRIPEKNKAEFKNAEDIKATLFHMAYQNFLNNSENPLHYQYRLFCEQESYWLDNFALYLVLKQHHQSKPWYQWPEEYKTRTKKALKEFEEDNEGAISKTKWFQFIFKRQWDGLKTYCNNLGIQLFGDLPFYVSYDSADVWSTPDIFSLDKDAAMIGVAGVPPDYFNSDGQLWGMPVFRWDILKERNYDWWVQRIRKNMELYDLLRLDHFRAFADYWEVPASEKTAKNGKWKTGPGKDFFNQMKKELGDLPFIAEDLGDISEEVVLLREELNLPGMKVLQFSFGNDLPKSPFIPHNYSPDFVAYTGTHDNNTTVGWFRENAGEIERENLNAYTGMKVKEKNIHEVMARLAYSSVAKIVILPIQDVLGLNEKARMNLPASIEKNWLWRLKPNQIKVEHKKLLMKWVKLFNRK